MNRSLAALAASAMLMASVPTIGFADESSSSSASSVTSSSASSESSAESSVTSETKKPCDELRGLLKAQCIVKHRPGKGNKKDRLARQNEGKALRLNSDCADKEGHEKVKCIRTQGKKGIKKLIRKVDNKRDLIRTLRGKAVDRSED